jgi:streptomycin 6-kinase
VGDVVSIAISQRLAVSLTAFGAVGEHWARRLPAVLSSLEADWGITCGAPLEGGNAAYVAEATTASGRPVVVKVALPTGMDGFSALDQEVQALHLAAGDPYVELIRHDAERHSVLLERLGRPLAALSWSRIDQLRATVETLERGWRPVAADRLPTGGAKAAWLADYVSRSWQELGQPCSKATTERAVSYAGEREACFEAGRAVLVHGDAHPNNLLQVPPSSGERGDFRLIDPEGLASEPAHDLGVVLRDWNEDLVTEDAVTVASRRHQMVSRMTGIDPEPIWQWSFVERVSSGLFLLSLGHDRQARTFLEAADRLTGEVQRWR